MRHKVAPVAAPSEHILASSRSLAILLLGCADIAISDGDRVMAEALVEGVYRAFDQSYGKNHLPQTLRSALARQTLDSRAFR